MWPTSPWMQKMWSPDLNFLSSAMVSMAFFSASATFERSPWFLATKVRQLSEPLQLIPSAVTYEEARAVKAIVDRM